MSVSFNSNETTMTVKANGFTLCYKLTKDTGTSPVSYSFFVSIENETENYYDEALIRNVTSSDATAYNILKQISEGTVTPMTLAEVIEDILS